MKNVKSIGLIGGVLGTAIGSYFSAKAIISSLNSAVVTGQQVGIYSAVTATILGMSLALIGIVYNQSSKNT
ncbi:hypothetical protein J7384_18820 [Endozoicomonas sp. G2_1]|uniref:hypothetical protein n=1 Tax=Endozoicomonas sp. G2_1 TaxID=2821091 RepID=UPI001ADA3241|nr:hypothetical protein [Endozoicomonas sp. G2_1]MBO9492422.1 hypothetical protein [Endozoicomonas sp. G2_1]